MLSGPVRGRTGSPCRIMKYAVASSGVSDQLPHLSHPRTASGIFDRRVSRKRCKTGFPPEPVPAKAGAGMTTPRQAAGNGPQAIQMSLNFALYSGYEKRKITREVLADKLGVTAFHSSEIVDKRRILDRVMKAIAEKIGRGHRESYPAHNFSSPKWKTLKQLAYL